MNQTTIICTDVPDEQQLLDMERLAALCRRRDQIQISCPADPDEGAWHFLMYRKAEAAAMDPLPEETAPLLLGVCSVVPCGEDTAECIAFTHPDARRQGVFSALLERALEQFGDRDILFPVSNCCPDACAVIDALGAEPDSEEFGMELDLEKWAAPAAKTAAQEPCAADALSVPETFIRGIRLVQVPGSEDGLTQWRLYQTPAPYKALSAYDKATTPCGPSQDILLGSCQTSALEGGSVCLHHVEVPDGLRRKGYGTLLLKLLSDSLQQNGVRRILLHVSGDNPAAIALYRKQGFRITETLSFYLY